MLGELSRSGVGRPTDVDCDKSVAGLREDCAQSNAASLRELREDVGAQALLAMTREDACLDRVSEPVPASEADLQRVLFNPRFGKEQMKEDGSYKVRAIDHLSWSPATAHAVGAGSRPTKRARKASSVNGHTAPAEKMSHDTLDALAAAMCKHVELMGEPPGLFKAGVCGQHFSKCAHARIVCRPVLMQPSGASLSLQSTVGRVVSRSRLVDR